MLDDLQPNSSANPGICSSVSRWVDGVAKFHEISERSRKKNNCDRLLRESRSSQRYPLTFWMLSSHPIPSVTCLTVVYPQWMTLGAINCKEPHKGFSHCWRKNDTHACRSYILWPNCTTCSLLKHTVCTSTHWIHNVRVLPAFQNSFRAKYCFFTSQLQWIPMHAGFIPIRPS